VDEGVVVVVDLAWRRNSTKCSGRHIGAVEVARRSPRRRITDQNVRVPRLRRAKPVVLARRVAQRRRARGRERGCARTRLRRLLLIDRCAWHRIVGGHASCRIPLVGLLHVDDVLMRDSARLPAVRHVRHRTLRLIRLVAAVHELRCLRRAVRRHGVGDKRWATRFCHTGLNRQGRHATTLVEWSSHIAGGRVQHANY
jgi:hypothetical protein